MQRLEALQGVFVWAATRCPVPALYMSLSVGWRLAEDGGIELYAKEPIQAGKRLMQLPADITLSMSSSDEALARRLPSGATVRDSVQRFAALCEASGPLQDPELAALVMLEAAWGSQSVYAPYLAALPPADELVAAWPPAWEPEHLAELAGLYCEPEVLATHAALERVEAEVLPQLPAEDWLGPELPAGVSDLRGLLRFALAVQSSRAFETGLTAIADVFRGGVPGVDVNVDIGCAKAEDGRLLGSVVQAVCDVPAGAALVIDYGATYADQFCQKFGCVPATAPMRLALPTRAAFLAMSPLQRSAMTGDDPEVEASLNCEDGATPLHLVGPPTLPLPQDVRQFCTVASLSGEEHVPLVEAIVETGRLRGVFSQGSISLELVYRLLEQMGRYPTSSSNEDADRLDDVATPPQARLALRMRICEREHALRWIHFLARHARQTDRDFPEPAMIVESVGAPLCDGCGASLRLKKCTRCRRVRYCSRACQRAAWRAHKAECVAPQNSA